MTIRLFGCKIYISLLFLTMITLMLMLDKTGLILLGFAAVFLHELGHLIAMAATGNRPRLVVLQPAGVTIKRGGKIASANDELKIASAGCLANLLWALIFLALYQLFKSELSLMFSASNLCVMGFNLIPVCGLDGYDIVLNLLMRKMLPVRAEKLSRKISLIFIFTALLGSFLLIITQQGSITLVICTIYLLILCIMSLRTKI